MSKNPEKSKSTVVREEAGERDLLTQILEEGRLARNEGQLEQAKDMIGQFVQQVMKGEMVVGRDLEASINARIAAIGSCQLRGFTHGPLSRGMPALPPCWVPAIM